MKLCFRWFGLVLAFVSTFGIVVIPADPAYAAPSALRGAAVDILRDPVMLGRLQQANPGLYSRLLGQSGAIRARISYAEWKQIQRFGATQIKPKHQRVSSVRIEGMEFSSQQRPRVSVYRQYDPRVKEAIDKLKAVSAAAENTKNVFTAAAAGATALVFAAPAAPFLLGLAGVAGIIKLWVDRVVTVLEQTRSIGNWFDSMTVFIFTGTYIAPAK